MIYWMNCIEIPCQYLRLILVGLQEFENGLHFGDPALLTLQILPCFQMCCKDSNRHALPEDLNSTPGFLKSDDIWLLLLNDVSNEWKPIFSSSKNIVTEDT